MRDCSHPGLPLCAAIGAVVEGVRRHLERVVVVDDGSDDATAEAARAAGAEVLRLSENRGKGVALRRGIELALEMEPRAILLLDADGQHDPADVPGLLAPWEGGAADLVIGSRSGRQRDHPRGALSGPTTSARASSPG